MDNEELAERIQYFNDIAAKHGQRTVSMTTAQRLFEEVAQPVRLGFSAVRKNLFGKQISNDIVHLLKFQAVKGGSFSIWWGVSLSYMPHKWQTQLEWHRTFKSSRLDLFEEPFECFHLHAVPWQVEERYFANGLYGEIFLRESLAGMWNTLQQSIFDWFFSARSYEGIVEKAKQQAARKWVGPRHNPDPQIIYAFTLARLGKIEDAQEALNASQTQSFDTPEAQNNLKQALLQMAQADIKIATKRID